MLAKPLLSKKASAQSAICEKFYVVLCINFAHPELWPCINEGKRNLVGNDFDTVV